MISRPLSLRCRSLVQHVLRIRESGEGDVRIAKGRIHVVVFGGAIIYRMLYRQVSVSRAFKTIRAPVLVAVAS
jgi:hypothetical protein